MLCKVKDDVLVPVSWEQTTLATDVSYETKSGDHQVYNNNYTGVAWEYKLTAVCHSTVNNTNFTFKANIGSNSISKVFSTPATPNQSFTLNYSLMKDTNSAENVTVKIYNSGSYSYNYFYVDSLKIWLSWLNIPGTTGVTWKPRVLKDITQKATITIFWVHTDGSRITQETE